MSRAPAYAHRLAEPLTELVNALAGPYEHIVFPGTTTGKNVAPRLAARLDVMVISEVTGVLGPDTFERPIYAGNAIQTVQSADAKKVADRARRRLRGDRRQDACPVETAPAAADPVLSSWVEDKVAGLGPARARLGADRGLGRPRLGSEENFAIIEKLADKLGAAVGASPRRGRLRLRAERLAGRADRQGRRAGALHRHRHLGRDPAPRGHEGQQGHRRDQQGRGGADLPG